MFECGRPINRTLPINRRPFNHLLMFFSQDRGQIKKNHVVGDPENFCECCKARNGDDKQRQRPMQLHGTGDEQHVGKGHVRQ